MLDRIMHAHPESYTTCQITAYFHDVELGRASGFIYKMGESYALVTNWHVLSGRHPDTLISLDRGSSGNRGYVPNRIEFSVTVRTLIQATSNGHTFHNLFFKPISTVLVAESGPIWWESKPDPYVHDVAILPLNDLLPELKEPNTDLWAIEAKMAISGYGTADAYVTNVLPEVAEEVFILGYPRGLTYQGRLPVWKRGTLASEPLFAVKYKDGGHNGIVYVDAATNAGMSGAPVLYYGNKLWTVDGKRIPAELWDAGSPTLVGVYAGRNGVTSEENAMGLGRIWKVFLVDSLFFDAHRQPGGTVSAQ